MSLRWREWRPLHNWLIIKGDPRIKKTAGGIVLPGQLLGIERVMEGSGRILKVGNRDSIREQVGADLEPGMRICFRGFLKDASNQFEFDPDEDGQLIFMLRAEDINAIITDDVTVGAFSRAQEQEEAR